MESEDHHWDHLIVKTSNKNWHSAELTYGTENEELIRKIVDSNVRVL